MKINLTRSQIITLQCVLAEDYVHGRVDDEMSGEKTVEPSWYRKLLRLGKAIEKQTGVASQVQDEHDDWQPFESLKDVRVTPKHLTEGEHENFKNFLDNERRFD